VFSVQFSVRTDPPATENFKLVKSTLPLKTENFVTP